MIALGFTLFGGAPREDWGIGSVHAQNANPDAPGVVADPSRHGAEAGATAVSSEAAPGPGEPAPEPGETGLHGSTGPGGTGSVDDEGGIRRNPTPDGSVMATSGAWKPWARGVSVVGQQRARELFETGNAMVQESLFTQATAQYRAALQYWNHPAIHYNLALALKELDQPMELRQHLIEALKYGPEGLGDDYYRRATRELDVVEQHLAKLIVSCPEPGAVVALDGRRLFLSPGRHTSFAEPGKHLLRATRAGFENVPHELDLRAARATRVELPLYRSEDLVQYDRRWPVWMPATVTAAGGAVFLTGALLTWYGQTEVEKYDSDVSRRCENGCSGATAEDLVRDRDRGARYRIAGAVSLTVGGAALLGGITLFYLNRAEPRRIEPELRTVETETAYLAPVLGPDTAGVVGGGRF